ncbi:putative transcriptional regulator [Mycobacteroides abscessus subsp. massiliense]|nr:putative transcriptional regulator [Mycobacteroides abscessus subsp. massiliense]SKK29263.1 putative transcriptional regulator [Mycobacteroides abscessus subsp. massiliense]SKK51109.1 putative transcriptional regulator [Mycobacteroides abscessus subsp. massiliense]
MMTIVYIEVCSIVNIVEVERRRLIEVGARLRALREERNQTQLDVARAVGVHRTYLGRLEAGRKNITLGVLYGLADHFGVTAATLLPD